MTMVRQFLVFISASLLTSLSSAQSVCQVPQAPCQQLTQYVADLQRNADDRELRKRIINTALQLPSVPKTPAEALEFEGAGEYAFKNAQSADDFLAAAKQYERALMLAPWKAADYFNLGVANEKAGRLERAIDNFELYLLAAPRAEDGDDVRKRIGALRFASNRAVEQGQAEERRRAVLASVVGTWTFPIYDENTNSPSHGCQTPLGEDAFGITRQPGGELQLTLLSTGNLKPTYPGVYSIEETRLTSDHVWFRTLQNSRVYGRIYIFDYDLRLSANGLELTGTRTYYFRGRNTYEWKAQLFCRRE